MNIPKVTGFFDKDGLACTDKRRIVFTEWNNTVRTRRDVIGPVLVKREGKWVPVESPTGNGESP